MIAQPSGDPVSAAKRQDRPDDDAEADEQIEDNDDVATVDAHGIPLRGGASPTSGTSRIKSATLFAAGHCASCLEQAPFVPKSEHVAPKELKPKVAFVRRVQPK